MAMLDALTQDVRLACRGLWRAKTFTATAVLTLASGIAGTTVMFALIQGVLLRPLPVHDQDRLIIAWKELRTSGSVRYPFGDTEIEAVAGASRLLERAAGVTRNGAGRLVMIDDGVSAFANVAEVTGGFFEVLGVHPVLGRALTPADDTPGGEHVIVISDGYWRRRFGASRLIVGRRVTLDDRPVRVVGVMPADLEYPAGVEVWRTTNSAPTDGPFGDAVRREVNLLARVRSGVTIAQATSEIAALSERLDAEAPANARRGLVPVVRPFAHEVVGDVRKPMIALFGAVGLVLLIACANVANLLLMRTEARRGELALRTALGAGRGRILGQALIESFAIAGLAGVVGLTIAWWSLQALITLAPDGLPRADSVRIDATVVSFSTGVALMTAFLAGLAPAMLSMRADLVSQLRGAGNGVTRSTGSRGRRLLVVAQVALAVTVVAAAGLLIQSVLALQSVELGLPADRLVLVDLQIPQAKYVDRRRHARFLDDVITRLEAAPAIAAATPVNLTPFSGQGWDLPRLTVEGRGAEQAAENASLNLESIHPNYFDTLQVPMLRGRAFTPADRDGAVDVAIVSEDVAKRMWPGEDPIGRRVKMGGPDSKGPWYVIAGVAGQTRYRDLRSPRPTFYLPAAQFQMTATMLVLRTSASIELVASLARDGVHAVDREVQVTRVAPFAEMLARPLARPRFNAFLLSIFGTVSLLLSTVGIYAVMAAYVRQRDREIAIRLALGATPTRVRRFVLAETIRLAGLAAIVGVAGAAAVSPLVRGMLFGVDPLDAPSLIGASLLLVAAAALASYLPVRRATRVDAMTILRGQ
jgi:putative ABC transport system permease protein